MTDRLQSVTPPGDPRQIMTIGESQGYQGLHVHYGITFDHAVERQTTELTTAWEPTPEQIAALLSGAKLIIRLINVRQHPPIAVSVEAY